MNSIKKYKTSEIFYASIQINITLFVIGFIIFWTLSQYMGVNYGNVIFGSLYDKVGFVSPEGIKNAIPIGMTWDLCNQLAIFSSKVAPCRMHWFGDFFNNYEVVQTYSPWITAGENPNFPLPNLLTKILSYWQYLNALKTYLIMSAVAMSIPLLHALLKAKADLKPLLFTAGCILTYPFLFTLDRANAQAFVPLLIYFIFYALSKDNTKLVVLLAPVLFAWKIHTWPLALLFIGRLNKNDYLKIGLFTLILIILPFGFWDASLVDSIRGWAKTIAGMTRGGGDQFEYLWRNQSLIGLLSSIAYKLKNYELMNQLKPFAKLTAIAWILFVLPLVLSKKLPLSYRAFSVCSIMIMAVPRGYGYGTNFVLAIIALFLVLDEELKFNNSKILEYGHKYVIPATLGLILSIDFGISFNRDYLDAGLVTLKNFTVPLAILIFCLYQYIYIYNNRFKT